MPSHAIVHGTNGEQIFSQTSLVKQGLQFGGISRLHFARQHQTQLTSPQGSIVSLAFLVGLRNDIRHCDGRTQLINRHKRVHRLIAQLLLARQMILYVHPHVDLHGAVECSGYLRLDRNDISQLDRFLE